LRLNVLSAASPNTDGPNSDCTAHQDQTEANGYPFQTRSPSDNDPFGYCNLIMGNVRLMLSRDIPLYNGSQVDWLKALGSLYHLCIPAQSSY
jgi:hypothetical protein